MHSGGVPCARHRPPPTPDCTHPPLTPQDQIEALETRFPDSPRVDILLGMKCEAEGDNERAREVYGALLREDGTNVVSGIAGGGWVPLAGPPGRPRRR